MKILKQGKQNLRIKEMKMMKNGAEQNVEVSQKHVVERK